MIILYPHFYALLILHSFSNSSYSFHSIHSVLWTVLNPQVQLAFNGNCCFIWTISSTWVINLTTIRWTYPKIETNHENGNQSRKWKSITPFVCWLKIIQNQTPTAAELPLCLRESSAQLRSEAPESWKSAANFRCPWLCSHWGCVQHLQTLQL